MINNEKNKSFLANIIAGITVLFVILMGIVVSRVTILNGFAINDESISNIDSGYMLEYHGNQKMIDLPYHIDGNVKEAAITRKINKDELAGNYIAFYVYDSYAQVYINDKLVYADKSSEDNLNFVISSHWYFINVPSDDFVIKIHMTTPFKIKNLLELSSGTKSALIYNIIKENIIAVVIGILSLILGIGMIVSSFFIKKDAAVRLRWLGLIALAAGMWIVTTSTVIQMFFGKIIVASYIGYSGYFLLPLFVLGYLMTYEAFSREWYIRILFYSMPFIIIGLYLMQFAGICKWQDLIWIVHIEVICIIICIIAEYIKTRHVLKNNEKDLYRALLIISGFLIIDVVRYYIVKPSSGFIKYSTFGLFIMFVYLGGSVIRFIRESFVQEAKKELYQELAFTDNMTQLGNRMAYEYELERLRQNPQAAGDIMIADLNNLKKINDSHGHQSGDAAIKETAIILKDCFDGIGKCYRIGGDEFCVISNIGVHDKFIKCFDDFIEKTKSQQKKVDYPYSVAAAYGTIDSSGVDECFKIVDAKMYNNKRRSKQSRESNIQA